MKRSSVKNKRGARRKFGKQAGRTKLLNMVPPPIRGGHRL